MSFPTNLILSGLRLLAGVTAVIAPKPLNGAAAQMVPERCVTHVDYVRFPPIALVPFVGSQE
jgi:hypothetical protein